MPFIALLVVFTSNQETPIIQTLALFYPEEAVAPHRPAGDLILVTKSEQPTDNDKGPFSVRDAIKQHQKYRGQELKERSDVNDIQLLSLGGWILVRADSCDMMWCCSACWKLRFHPGSVVKQFKAVEERGPQRQHLRLCSVETFKNTVVV